MDEPLENVAELSKRTGMPASWIYSQCEAGALPHLKVGKYLRFIPSEVNAWFLERRRGPRPVESRPTQ